MTVPLDPYNSVYAGLVVFIAYLVRGVAGFGSGLIAVPLLALQFPLAVIVPVVVLLDYVGSASQGIKNCAHIAWREQLPLIPFTLMGVAEGILLLTAVTAAVLGKALGGFIIIYAVYQLLPLPVLHGSRLLAIPHGLLGGFIGTLFGTGGPFYVIYFNLRHLPKSTFRATLAANFLIDGAIRLTAYATIGFFQPDVLLALIAALPLAVAGLYLGGRLQLDLSRDAFARVISILLIASGTILILKT